MGSRGGKNEPLQKSKSDYKYELLNQSWEFGGGIISEAHFDFYQARFCCYKVIQILQSFQVWMSFII